MTDFELKVYKLTEEIPKGMVTTYGEIARALRNKGLARAVGNALHKNPYEGIVPCHRVVSSSGCMAENFGFGGPLLQQDMLRKEGVEVINLRVDLKKFMYIYK